MVLSQGARPGGTLLQDSAYTPHRKGKGTVRMSPCQGLPAWAGQPGQGGRIWLGNGTFVTAWSKLGQWLRQ